MKKINYINHNGIQKSVECENFAIGAQSHSGCQLSFLGELVPGGADEAREITGQVYDVKVWWVEDVEVISENK